MTWVLVIFISLFIYCNIGYLFAHISWKTWHNVISNKNINNSDYKRKITKYWYVYLIFPISFSIAIAPGVPIDLMNERQYKRAMMLSWPIKVLFNTSGLIGIGLPIAIIYGVALLIIQIGKLFTLPIRKIFRINSA